MFSSVICCSQCHLVSDLQSFFVIVCLETWQNTRGNGSCDTGCLFMSFQLLYACLHVLIVLMIMTEKTDCNFFLFGESDGKKRQHGETKQSALAFVFFGHVCG